MEKYNNSHSRGKLFIVGIGPGSIDHLTHRAKKVIENCEVLIGYRTYINLIKKIVKDQTIIASGMGQEMERSKKAIELAAEGRKVVLISSGDSGIYGMAGPVYETVRSEFLETLNKKFSIEVVPGVPALCAASSCLGAPLMNDFVSISLSDLLTPREEIEKRIELAARGDFVICLYNPKSKRRIKQIKEAQKILLKFRKEKTVVGIVRNASRQGESIIITDLKDMLNYKIDMSTIVLIGNSSTFSFDSVIVTKRGYKTEKNDKFQSSTTK